MERIAIHSGKHENITQIAIFSFEEPMGRRVCTISWSQVISIEMVESVG
jgi:hypothetical protein